MPIPRILHQLWPDANVPARYALLQQTWRKHHPDWEFRLWTDRDLLDLVERCYPALASIYRGYDANICRADLGRYLVLYRFGGVYTDMDCECLRPVAPLLDGSGFVIGVEPDEHLAEAIVVQSGLSKIVCASFIACVPDHDFWPHVFDHIRAARAEPGPLDATGPFLLTRAVDSYEARPSLTLLPSRILYPVTKEQCWSGQINDIQFWESATRDAHVLHYWDGTWFRDAGDTRGLPTTFSMSVTDTRAPRVAYPEWANGPRISCILVMEGPTSQAKTAIGCFLRQTYPNRELIIVAPAAERARLDELGHAGRPEIRLIPAVDETSPADLRALAVEQASGPLVCRWDPDDLHDDRRLEVQYEALRQTGAHASLLRRWLIWSPEDRRIAVGRPSAPVATMLCLKIAVRRRGRTAPDDGAEFMTDLPAEARVVVCDMPRLYVHPSHGADVDWPADTVLEGERHDAVVEELAKRLPMEDHLPADDATTRSTGPEAGDRPPVLVLTPIKNARRHLARYAELLNRLDYDPAALSVAFLEGDSSDGTAEALDELLPSLRRRFARAELFRHDYGFNLEGDRAAPRHQRQRREIIARARNRLLSGALRDEDWVLWLDADLVDYPPDLLLQLLAADKDIVVPHCVLPHGATFDLNTFCFSVAAGGRDDARYLVDGLFQPPRGANRLYLETFKTERLVPVDGVGGTALLIRADLHREGLSFPPFAYRGYIETEGLAMMAKDMGHQCWAMPRLRIVHAAD